MTYYWLDCPLTPILELEAILLPQPLKCWDYRHVILHPILLFIHYFCFCETGSLVSETGTLESGASWLGKGVWSVDPRELPTSIPSTLGFPHVGSRDGTQVLKFVF